MLTDSEVHLLREELATAKNPLFLYDGDGDGLTSFLLLYKINREGKGIALNMTSIVDEQFIRKVQEIDPDKIFILDVPLVKQEFVDQAKRPIFWIDHHPPGKITKVKYFNPRLKDKDAYIPTSRMCWQVSQHPEDLWIAAAGSLADYHLPDFIDDFIKAYPDYLDQKLDLKTILYHKQVGKLVKLFFFLQKGPSSEVRKSVKILTRVKSPDEIFKQTTAQGKFLYKRFVVINEMYEELLVEAKKSVTKEKLVLFNYTEKKWSFTANLSNELFGLFPEKIILIARRKSGEVKCSLRGINVLSILQNALQGIEGHGGGHPEACGAVIKEQDWEQFLDNFKREMNA